MVTCPADRFSYRVHIIGACAPRWPIHHARTRGRRRRATRCSALRDRSIPRPARIIELLSRQSNCRYKCYWQFFPWDSIVQEIEWLETETMNAAGPDDAALEKSAYRKASLRILPLIALGYGAAYIDRVNISFASMQMNRDLNFSATVYGFGAGLFFLSYGGGRELSRCALAGKIRPRYASPTTHRDALHTSFGLVRSGVSVAAVRDPWLSWPVAACPRAARASGWLLRSSSVEMPAGKVDRACPR